MSRTTDPEAAVDGGPAREASTDAILLPSLMPPTVRCSQWQGNPRSSELPPALHPDEYPAVARAVSARQREFAFGRHCARQALEALCGYRGGIPAQADRSPLWPPGVVGSITHDDRVVAAAVAHRADFAGIGIDIDRIDRFDDTLAPIICGEAEWAIWRKSAPSQRRLHLALIFCIKEAVYKAQYPVTGTWLDFADLQVVLPVAKVGRRSRVETGEWRALLTRAVGLWPAGQVFAGSCAFNSQRVAAALLLRDEDCKPTPTAGCPGPLNH